MDKKICLKCIKYARKCAKAIIINNKERNVASKTLRVLFSTPTPFVTISFRCAEKTKGKRMLKSVEFVTPIRETLNVSFRKGDRCV